MHDLFRLSSNRLALLKFGRHTAPLCFKLARCELWMGLAQHGQKSVLFKTYTHNFCFNLHLWEPMILDIHKSTHSYWLDPWLFYRHIITTHSYNTETCSIYFKGYLYFVSSFFFIQLCSCFILSQPEALCFLSSWRMKKYEYQKLCREFRKITVTIFLSAVFMASYTDRTAEKVQNLGQFFQLCTIQHVAMGELKDSLRMPSNNRAIPV